MESSGRGTERHSAVVWVIYTQIAFLSPPFGYSLFYLKSVSPPEVSMATIIRGALPFMGLQLLGVTLCIVFPGIVLWLPKLLLCSEWLVYVRQTSVQ